MYGNGAGRKGVANNEGVLNFRGKEAMLKKFSLCQVPSPTRHHIVMLK